MPKAVDFLIAERKHKCLTQEQIGKRLGVSKQTISAWERQKRKVSFETVVEWANLLDIPLAEIFSNV